MGFRVIWNEIKIQFSASLEWIDMNIYIYTYIYIYAKHNKYNKNNYIQ